MTRRRIVDAGATLALSRRTTRRHFLLHPDEARQMEQVYWYCLAYAAKLHGVLVHAACLMSTHSHEVITARTSTDLAPWHLVPANDKRSARIQVFETVCDTLEAALRARG